jgi:hypothetical protein
VCCILYILVCKEWRQLILGSSSLWGKLLDLNDLNPGSDRWRKEVLRRTKNAMLHVRVDLDPARPVATSLLFDILDKKWSTIRNLEVSTSQRGHYDDKRWLAIHRPTDNLRTISLHFQMHVPEPLRSTNNVLFSGRAPSLKFATIRHMTFQLPAQWFSQLYAFRIAGQYRASQLMESMSSMSFLEYVQLSDLRSDDAEFWPTISLPQLKHLIIDGQFAACLKVVSHTIVPPGCGLQILRADRREYITDADLLAASQVLARYCETYFKVHIPTTIRLSIHRTVFDFSNIPAGPNIPSFNLRIEKSNRFSSMDLLFKPFLNCPFCKVTDLFFDFESDANVTFPFSDPKFSNFISLFSSVDRLTTTPAGLQVFVETPTHNDGILLPALKTIRVLHLTGKSLSQIIDFLNWRHAVGAPIQVLTLICRLLLGLNLSTLEQYSGLKVVCRRNGQEPLEYICGSGTPEQIDFRLYERS